MRGRGIVLFCALCLFVLLPSQGFSGDCEVASFNAYESSYVATPYYGGTAPVYKNQCATVTIRSYYQVGRFVKDATIVVKFQNETTTEGRLEPLDPVNQNADYPMRFGDTYTGRICFPGDSAIKNVECFFDAR